MVANCCTLTDERECSPPPPLPSPSSAASKSLGRRHHTSPSRHNQDDGKYLSFVVWWVACGWRECG